MTSSGRRPSSELMARGRVHSLPKRDVDKPFLMPVEDTFRLPVATVVTGRVEIGVLKTGDEVNL